jgi:hypothetical protein
MRSFVGAMLFVLSGCASAHLYPVCFYNSTRPTAQDFTNYYEPGLKEALRTAARLSPNAEITGTPDGRWLIANVADSQNKNAASVWPRVGCIGNANNSARVSNEEACVSYEQNFVRDKNYYQFGTLQSDGSTVLGEAVNGITVLNCQTVSTASDP